MKTLLLFVIAILAGCATPQDWLAELRGQIEVKWPNPSWPFPAQPEVAVEVRSELAGFTIGAHPVFVKDPVYHDPSGLDEQVLAGSREKKDLMMTFPPLAAPSEIELLMGRATQMQLKQLFYDGGAIVVEKSCDECLVVEPHLVLYGLPADRRVAYLGMMAMVEYKGGMVAVSRQWAGLGRRPVAKEFENPKAMLGAAKIIHYETIAVLGHVFGAQSAVGATK